MTNLNTKIEWTEATWNVVTGCTKVSPGCDNCYAERITERFNGKGSFAEVKLHHDRLEAPLRWRKPRRVFVNSMSDLFHDAVPDEFIATVWAIMVLTPQHTYQILTKRHGRMRSLLNSDTFSDAVIDMVADHPELDRRRQLGRWPLCEWEGDLPLPNVWLGVSVEDQKRADLRIPALLGTPAAVRFLSCEPLIGPIQLGDWVDGIDWVIAGGESGPGHRPIDPDWVRSLRDQCQAARTAFFFKQWGGQTPKSGGRALDGREWSEFPASVTAAAS